MWLQATAGPKHEKLRVHVDLRPDGGDVDAEVQRIVRLGGTMADVGQTEADPFVVLADPEGNEFCVLRNVPRLV